MGMFRDDSLDGENLFANENKHSWLDAFRRGAKVTNDTRRKRRAQTGRVRKRISSTPPPPRKNTWSLW